ncbi:MAG: DUF4159 domain-containing protein [Nibricoccus sp.]
MWRTMRYVFWIVSASLSVEAAEKPRPTEKFRGGTVEWARLKHSGGYWNRHAESDDAMISYMRAATTLNIGSEWCSAAASDLGEMTRYPFLFADTLQHLSASEKQNLVEYLKRGGFIFIDACCNNSINPSGREFLFNHLKILQGMLPGLEVEVLDPSHEVFSIYFKMQAYPPQSRPGGTTWSNGPTFPLRSLKFNGRVVGMLSISGLQCGWARMGRQDATPFVQMMANIYLYAITH